jgi:glutathione S-transferase
MPAEQDTLQEVFGIEREINSKLAAERQQVDQWLERTRSEIERATQSEIARLRARAAQDEKAANEAARDKAAESLRLAAAAAERVGGLDNAQLAPIVRQHLAAIMPGNAA